MPQQTPHPPAVLHVLPSRPAAIGLLAIDAVLLALPLVVRWRDWFAFAYLPLLITVVLGLIMSGWFSRLIVMGGAVVLCVIGALWVTLKVSATDPDRVGVALQVGAVALICVALVWVAAAAWGWFRFFRGRAAAA